LKTLRIKKGYRFRVEGRPGPTLKRLGPPETVALVPEHIPFIKPRLIVHEGDKVKAGSLLLEDKHRPELKFRSPGGGIVESIRFGPRRVLKAVVIRLDPEEARESFHPMTETEVDQADRSHLVERIQEGGLWPLFRELPFRNIPESRIVPPTIIVTLGTKEPFEPFPSIYLRDREALFLFGIRILEKLSPRVDVVLDSEYAVPELLAHRITGTVSGEYPCGDAGVFLHHSGKDGLRNRSWFLHGQEVLLLARFFREGRYPTERIMALAGPGTDGPCHCLTRTGIPLNLLVRESPADSRRRFVVGGLFTGYGESEEGYLGFREAAVTILRDDAAPEYGALFNPGYRKPTYSRAFLSRLNPDPLVLDCRYHGEERACIGCGFCAEVCPVDILPQFTYKAVRAGEMEEALEHGILDCVECGLCSHVCPSKIELGQTFKAARIDLFQEQRS